MSTSFANPRRRVVLGIAGTLAAPAIVRAQSKWKPERPITIYNPFAAGGATDLHLRFLAEKASKILGQQVVVEVKAGAAGTLAPAQLLTARAHPGTLFMTSPASRSAPILSTASRTARVRVAP